MRDLGPFWLAMGGLQFVVRGEGGVGEIEEEEERAGEVEGEDLGGVDEEEFEEGGPGEGEGVEGLPEGLENFHAEE